MAFQVGYNTPYYQQMLQQQQLIQQLMQQQQAQNQQAQQTQQSGFVLVRSEDEARNYPVAPGNSITFKDESRDYCYVKSMGYNQLDRPVFERYRMVKEDDAPASQASPAQSTQREPEKPTPQYALKADLDEVWAEIESLKAKLKPPVKKKIVEVEEDDE